MLQTGDAFVRDVPETCVAGRQNNKVGACQIHTCDLGTQHNSVVVIVRVDSVSPGFHTVREYNPASVQGYARITFQNEIILFGAFGVVIETVRGKVDYGDILPGNGAESFLSSSLSGIIR